ncbi:MAG: M48 family metallopeptidase [Leptospiraceae bacterium]|nr:M48 family metallopeptidase [Leptospiraceae bacterium]
MLSILTDINWNKLRILQPFALALVFALALAACESLQNLAGGLGGPSDEEMNQLGTEAFEEIKKETPIDRSGNTNTYVNCITGALLAQIRNPDGSYPTGVTSWEVVVFRDNTANAFALPGGKIGVHTGILPVAQNQHQLAAVLGHEVAHVTQRHGKQRMVSSGYAQMAIGVIGETVFGDSEYKDEITGAMGAGAVYGVIMPFGRSHESEADLIGQETMARAGFNPTESVTLWVNMAQAGGGAPPEFLSTHPSHETRINDLRANLSKTLPLYQAASNRPNCRL